MKRIALLFLTVMTICCLATNSYASGNMLTYAIRGFESGNCCIAVQVPANSTAKTFSISGSVNGGNVPSGAGFSIVINGNSNYQYYVSYGTGNNYFDVPYLLQSSGTILCFYIYPNNTSCDWNYFLALYD